ncbi:MAG: LamG-like jellyroll fold domain-containing protein [archaeon]
MKKRTKHIIIAFSIAMIALLLVQPIVFATDTSSVHTDPALYLKLDGTSTDAMTGKQPDYAKVSFVSGIIGQGITLPSSDSYIQYSCADRVSYTAGTASAWIKFDQFSRNDQVIFHTDDSEIVLGYDDGMQNGYKRIYARQAYPQTEPSFYMQANSNAKNLWKTGEWHFVAMTWSQGLVSLYIDGKLVQSAQNTLTDSGCDSFRIGNNYWPGQNFADGTIDHVKVYTRALSAEDIKNEYASINIPSVQELPDLIITSVSSPHPGWLSVLVNNAGNAPVTDFFSVVAADQNGKEYSMGQYWTVEKPLKAGESTSFDTSNIPAGKYTFKIVVDPDQVIMESNEHNNQRTETIIVSDTAVYCDDEPTTAGCICKEGYVKTTTNDLSTDAQAYYACEKPVQEGGVHIVLTPVSQTVKYGATTEYRVTVIDQRFKPKISCGTTAINEICVGSGIPLQYNLSVSGLSLPYSLSQKSILLMPGRSTDLTLKVWTPTRIDDGGIETQIQPAVTQVQQVSNTVNSAVTGNTLAEVDDNTASVLNTASSVDEQTVFLKTQDSAVVDGKTVRLLNVGSNGVIVVNVDGVQETVKQEGVVNGLNINVKDSFYADTLSERTATLNVEREDTTSTAIATSPVQKTASVSATAIQSAQTTASGGTGIAIRPVLAEQVPPIGSKKTEMVHVGGTIWFGSIGVKLINVASSGKTVVVSVDGVQKTIVEDGIVNGVQIHVAQAYYTDALEYRAAELDLIYVGSNSTVHLNVGDTVNVDGRTLKLLNVASSGLTIVVSVDGVQKTISTEGTDNGVHVRVISTFYSDVLSERSAELVLSGTNSTQTFYAFYVVVQSTDGSARAMTPGYLTITDQQQENNGGVDIDLQPSEQTMPFGGSVKYIAIIADKHTEKNPSPQATSQGEEYWYTVTVTPQGAYQERIGATYQARVSVGRGSTADLPIVIYSKETAVIDENGKPLGSPFSVPFIVTVTDELDTSQSDKDQGVVHIGKDEQILPPPMPVGEEFTITLQKGWNLVSVPGKIVKFNPGACLGEKKPVAFVYLDDQQKYVTIADAQKLLGSNFATYLSTHSFWVYNFDGVCSFGVELVDKSGLQDLSIAKGWTLLPVTYDAIGKNIQDISPCISSSYTWNAPAQNWQKIESVTKDILGSGILVKSQQACEVNA